MYSGQIEFAELLINHGANINMADENGNIPLHLAVEDSLGHVKILELLSKGDNINNFYKNGKSLLHLSIEKGYNIFDIFTTVQYSSI